MGRVKEWLFAEEYEAMAEWNAESAAERKRSDAGEAERRLAQEQQWAAEHPSEWAEWTRISDYLVLACDFRSFKLFDFADFLKEVGPRPSLKHRIARRNDNFAYEPTNLVWVKAHTPTEPRVDSPYLTVSEAADYCRRKPKTLLNHHCAGHLRSITKTRPLLFKREDLDDWLAR